MEGTDPVTRLPNRDALLVRLDDEIARAERYGVPLSLLLADIDGFPRIIGEQGEAAGDALLQRLALSLLATIREADTAARIGTDKFALLLPDTGASGALARARRLSEDIRATDLGEDGAPLFVTIRIGLATFGPGLAESGALMAHAEEALRMAKQQETPTGAEEAAAIRAFPEGDAPGTG